MKPKPFASLNHLTVPFSTLFTFVEMFLLKIGRNESAVREQIDGAKLKIVLKLKRDTIEMLSRFPGIQKKSWNSGKRKAVVFPPPPGRQTVLTASPAAPSAGSPSRATPVKASASARPVFLGPGFVYRQVPPSHAGAVQTVDRPPGRFVVRHFDKPKSARLSGGFVCYQADAVHLPVRFE